MAKNYYDILQIPIDATQGEIRDAYFKAVKIYHPDVTQVVDPVGDGFLTIQEAYDVISDTHRRAVYDLENGFTRQENPITIDLQFSSSEIPRIEEPQLFYILMQLHCVEKLVDQDTPPNHVCLVVDRSTSMAGERIDLVKNGAVQLVEKLRPTDYISIVSFSDRAEVIVPPTQARETARIIGAIQSITTSGATEICQGLLSGVSSLLSTNTTLHTKLLVLLTDGHTYGDEDAAFELIQKASENGISFNAVGIGHEWNDKFLDQLAGLAGGSTYFITTGHQLNDYWDRIVHSIQQKYSRNIILSIEPNPSVELNYAFRLAPDQSALELGPRIVLGDVLYDQDLRIILEFIVQPQAMKNVEVNLINGKIWMERLTGASKSLRLFLDIRRPAAAAALRGTPSPEIIEAMGKLTLYRIQERARQEVECGELYQAKRHLHHLATSCLAQGNRDLARSILMETEYLLENRHFSQEGDKRIKYGTRNLLQLPKPK